MQFWYNWSLLQEHFAPLFSFLPEDAVACLMTHQPQVCHIMRVFIYLLCRRSEESVLSMIFFFSIYECEEWFLGYYWYAVNLTTPVTDTKPCWYTSLLLCVHWILNGTYLTHTWKCRWQVCIAMSEKYASREKLNCNSDAEDQNKDLETLYCGKWSINNVFVLNCCVLTVLMSILYCEVGFFFIIWYSRRENQLKHTICIYFSARHFFVMG